MRKFRKGVYLDYLHKGCVCTCIAATLYAASCLTWRGFQYVVYVRPQSKKLQEAENRKLLDEGSSGSYNDTTIL